MTDQSFETEIKEFIADEEKIAILGIGNDLRSDDGLGPYIVNTIKFDNPNVMIENVGSVPEAFSRS